MPKAWDGFRLSRQQERLLVQVRAGASTRTVAAAHIDGSVDRVLLGHALFDLIKAHESLRTVYRPVLGENGSLLMVIEEPQALAIDMQNGDADAAAAWMQTERERATDVGADAPLRVALFAHDGRHTLILSAARMSVDTVSVPVLLRDLQQAYASRLADQPWQRDDIVQYADFAQWQSEQSAPSARQKELMAERDTQLAELPALHLPLELNSADLHTHTLDWTVPAALTPRLREQGSLRSVVLAAWNAALWHACGRPERVAIETVVTRRPFEELQHAIGAFEQAMPAIAALGDTTTLRELLRMIDLELDVLEQTDEALVKPLPPGARQLPGFAFIEQALAQTGGALTLSALQTAPAGGSGKVALTAVACGDALHLTLRYQAAGMADGGPEALMTCLQAALTAFAADSAQALGTLAMLPHAAGLALIAATNPTPGADAPKVHWHQLVEQVATRAPQTCAVRFNTRRWTYRELDQSANRLAHELGARGVGAGTLVGLHLERSDLAIVAMLAIAKAGAAYVPVDPALPAKRQAQIFTEAALRHVVTLASDLPDGVDAVVLDAALSVCATRSESAPRVQTLAHSPAYVLFTSGSTGVPKGVVVGHGQLAAYLDNVTERLGLSGAIDAVALGSLATDLGNTALFPALTSGGELLVIAPDVAADAQTLAAELAQASYDLMKITPSHLASVFAVADAPEQILPRQRLVLGGEPFSWGWFNLFQSFTGQCQIFNHYGPTETTVGVLCGQTSSNALAALASTVPLGRPMRHARAYVLDPQQRPLPYGVPGELWIGGATVANGYLSQREGQAERFFADPFSQTAGARMYRSGDRVRHLPDGSIEFLGRIDRQVKVRGFRVELGEIEAVMRLHPRVSASLAIEAGESSATHIVGYLVDAEGSRGNADWLRSFMSEHLPDFMIPTHFVALDRFPLTSAGKIDAAMLPEPGAVGDSGQPYVEPRTPTETALAGIIAELLLLKRVGAEDDFFDIGGHSLLATQLIARLRKAFQIDLKLRSLFERSVVSELAELIDARVAAKAGQA
ncbi:non-ribosomal peptide synthetase [Massilia sp. CF038]|uniref:non-ribosomal peptide synthetase n=1 Tax=Massilia sp. CF038 TaxID=1881045 RepID=UPI0009215CB3|nr:non-ribosomal peptide synthetase [Massilia sp. CF038]SHG61208.1 amino acid adenylation domain-containing protein [Massilia sp. CF038]